MSHTTEKRMGIIMAIGERIHFLRNLRGMTLRYLGTLAGFPEKTADVRMAQYESGVRTPKADLTKKLADALVVAPEALNVPEIDTYNGLMHTLFAIEDIYGLKIGEIEGEVCIRIDRENGIQFDKMLNYLSAWQEQRAKYEAGEISKEDYDQWRYTYPWSNMRK